MKGVASRKERERNMRGRPQLVVAAQCLAQLVSSLLVCHAVIALLCTCKRCWMCVRIPLHWTGGQTWYHCNLLSCQYASLAALSTRDPPACMQNSCVYTSGSV